MPTITKGDLVLVTGASGFIASHTVREFLKEGYRVRGTVRSDAKGKYLEDLFKGEGDFTYVIAEDITTDGVFDEAVKGVDAVAHLASPFYVTDVKDPQELIGPATKGTEGILKSIQKNAPGIKRIVITSSVASVMSEQKNANVKAKQYTEADWNEDSIRQVKEGGKDTPGSASYRASKTLAEQSLWKFIETEKPSWDAASICPPLVLGEVIHQCEKPENLNTSVAGFYSWAAGQKKESDLPALLGNFVNVKDVAMAHVKALVVPEAGGERFITGNGAFAGQDYCDILHKHFKDLKNIPVGNPGTHAEIVKDMPVFVGAKATKVLGVQYKDLEATVVEMAKSLNERTLLELNSNVEWWNHYVDYGGLKKLFPSVPLDPEYLSTHQQLESSSLLPTHNASHGGKFASPDEFRQALDREREKVVEFYRSKEEELRRSFALLEDEVEGLEERDLEDDTIREEDEELAEGEGGEGEDDALLNSQLLSPALSTNTRRPSNLFSKFTPRFGRKRNAVTNTHEADIMEASIPSLRKARSRSSQGIPKTAKPTGSISSGFPFDEAPVSPTRGRDPGPKRPRRSSDLDSSDDMNHDRRTSFSSTSSNYGTWPKSRRLHALGLVQMDPTTVPSWAISATETDEENRNIEVKKAVFIWSANGDYGTVMRIGFKKRISAIWLEAYALKQYVDLNTTAFEKILKKYDKNTNSKLKKRYIEESVQTSYPWLSSTKEDLDHLLARILFLYRRVATSGDEDLAKEQLRAQLREKVVVDRETVWSQMVTGHNRSQGLFRSVEPDQYVSIYEPDKTIIKTRFGSVKPPKWITAKGCIFAFAVAVLLVIVRVQPFDRVEESNCLAMLVFCTILWATEAIPLFVTSLAVPLLVVFLRVLRSSDEEDRRLSAAESTKFIFSQMFSPTIMLLIGGFTIAAVLSKTRLDVMTATRILNAAGTRPSVVLLVLMFVATFASMWISNVAAPTLCYALIKPITDELHPKSVFSRCLIIAIALASNIGGQASPISSPQNLIALGSMDPPLSWLQWFAISIPVSGLSVFMIWAFLHLGYKWEPELSIPKMRKNTDSLSKTHYYVLFVTVLTIALWCAEKSMEEWVGDMGIIALIPLIAFFGTGILSKVGQDKYDLTRIGSDGVNGNHQEDFHAFHWSIVFLAMGGIALGKAVLSSGLLDDLDAVLERLVDGLGLYSILIVFSCIALVIATFISHTIAAVLLVPIATRIGDSLDEPHPKLLIMATALICSAGMGLPVSGFPNMTAITQENKLGQRFIEASDFLKNGVPASILATFVIVTVGYAIMRSIG
ncbi:phosphate transporter, partial [Tremellales sp. Uapishka_1]